MSQETLREIYRGVGSLAFPPEPLLKIVLYEYLQGHHSPAHWHKHTPHHDALKWLGRGFQPSRSTWYDFRDRLAKCIDALIAELVQRMIQEGLAQPQVAAQDGTTFRAFASRHRVVNQGTLNKRREILEQALEADQQLQKIEEAPQWMPATPRGRQELQQRMDAAQQVLDQRLEYNANKPKSKQQQERHIVVSLSEPEAAVSRDKEKVFCPLYTAQFLVDYDSLLVLGYSVAAAATDVGTLTPMIDQVQQTIGSTLQRVVTDATYATVLDLQDCQERHIDLIALVQENSRTASKQQEKKKAGSPAGPTNRDEFRWLPEEQTYECPAGHKLNFQWKEQQTRHGDRQVTHLRFHCPPEHCMGCPLAPDCVTNPSRGRTIKRLEGQELIDEQKSKMQQPEAKQLLRQRNQVVERAFGDSKGNRKFRRFHGRGLARVRTEIGLLVLAQNIMHVERVRSHAVNTAA